MKILAIETSCDETAVALLDITGEREHPDIKVLGNNLYSQSKLHAEYGGVYPNLAKREHEKNLPILLEKTLKDAGMADDVPDIEYIAVTRGPGLEPALWAGITFAEEIGRKWGKPVLGIDHMEGHIFSVLYKRESVLELPALALLVSGGHTELVLVRDFCDYEILGKTLDDAVGEAFDKVARMLGLPYPGGPEVSKLAEQGREQAMPLSFSVPMLHSKNLNFSYSGLKTQVLYKIKKLGGELTEEMKREVARAFEDSAVGELVGKTRDALEKISDRGVKSLIVAGGVSANKYLQTELKKLIQDYPDISLIFPDRELTGDNAVMIGIASWIRVKSYPQVVHSREKLVAEGRLPLTAHPE